MKKIFTLLAMVMCFVVGAHAIEYTVNITIDKPDNVSVEYWAYDDSYNKVLIEVLTPVDNKITFKHDPSAEGSGSAYIRLYPKNNSIINVKALDGNTADTSTDSEGRQYKEIGITYWLEYDSSTTEFNYEVSAMPYDEYYCNKVKVTIDNPDKVSMQIGERTIYENSATMEIAYNPDTELRLGIRPKAYNSVLNTVTADGEPVEASAGIYYVTLAKGDGTFVENVDIKAEFPDDYTHTVKIDIPEECRDFIKTYKTDGTESDKSALFTADGIQLKHGTQVRLELDRDNFDCTAVYINDVAESYIPWNLDIVVLEDQFIKFDVTAYEQMPYTLRVEGAEYINYTIYYEAVEIHDGDNNLTFTKNMSSFRVQLKDYGKNSYFAEVKDLTTGKDYLAESYFSGTIYPEKGSVISIIAKPIIRDKVLVCYLEEAPTSGIRWQPGDSYIDDDKISIGYNTFYFYDAEKYIDVFNYHGVTKAYANDQPVENEFEYDYYFRYSPNGSGDVLKLFYSEDGATEHNVTFNVDEGALEGYEVKKDIIADVDYSAPVFAVGETRFTISPVSRAGEAPTVTLNDEAVEADENGVFTFTTKADAAVKVTKDSSGIENVDAADHNNATEYYDMQGRRIAKPAAGIYIMRQGSKAVKIAK